MRVFKDKHNREWAIDLTVGAMSRVKSMAGIDLLRMVKDADGHLPVERLLIEADTLLNVLYAVLRPQLAAKDIDDEAFGESLGPEHVTPAQDAFLAEWADFFQRLGRTAEAKCLRTLTAAVRQMESAARAKAESMDVDTMTQTIFGKLSGSSPESSASIPTGSD